jgi:phosphatidylglycerophosphatase A
LALACSDLFDIAKPWPIGYLDRKVHGGLGIMVDDVVPPAYWRVPALYALRMLF